MWRQHTDIQTYIHTDIHTDGQTEPNYDIDYITMPFDVGAAMKKVGVDDPDTTGS